MERGTTPGFGAVRRVLAPNREGTVPAAIARARAGPSRHGGARCTLAGPVPASYTRMLAATVALTTAVAVVPAPVAAAVSAWAAPDDVDATIERAQRAWSAGQWSEVRALLDPLATAPAVLDDRVRRARVLPMLADATLSDESISKDVRERLAAGYLDTLLEHDTEYRLPQGVYSPELYQMFMDRLQARERADAAHCIAERNACRADLAAARRERAELEKRYADLERRFEDQEVEVRKVVKRSRVFALFPFGIGHFYNGLVGRKGTVTPRERRNLALGGTFLALEVASGAAGLGLLLQRIYGFKCKRESGFDRRSVHCATAEDNRQRVEDTRKAEEVMGWIFLGSVVLDVVLAQVLFEPLSTAEVRRVPRRELDRENPAPSSPPARKRKRPRASIRPGAAILPAGAGISVRGRF
ncbi:MAG: hypothetical protein D6705_09210 [Deltaproteobacteria bacterium]|nr:MAG: hypothetical protein D6705_09210 [Deltaproteobacteria bacterium]